MGVLICLALLGGWVALDGLNTVMVATKPKRKKRGEATTDATTDSYDELEEGE